MATKPLHLPALKVLVFISLEEEKDLLKISLFIINKAITSRAGPPVTSIMILNNGTLLVETISKKQCLSLLKISSFFNQVKVSVELYQSFNYSKEVVACKDLLHITLKEIKPELAEQVIIDVTRIM